MEDLSRSVQSPSQPITVLFPTDTVMCCKTAPANLQLVPFKKIYNFVGKLKPTQHFYSLFYQNTAMTIS